MPTAAQALPVATSNRNMLAPSSRCMAFRCPDWSSTTTVTGLIFISRAFSSALAMIWVAFARFSVDIPLLRERPCQILHCRMEDWKISR